MLTGCWCYDFSGLVLVYFKKELELLTEGI